MKTIGIILLFSSFAFAGANITFKSPELQSDFVANATTYFDATVAQSAFFPQNVNVAVNGRKSTPPPPPDPGIPTCTAFNECMAHGFANGMLEERRQVKNDVRVIQSNDFVNKTCAGSSLPLVSTTTMTVSYGKCMSACHDVYNVIDSTISFRDGMIFTSTGGVVSQ